MPALSIRSTTALIIVASVMAVAGLGRVEAGADFGHYLEWSKAFLAADLTQMVSPVVSPEGYPLRQHFPGTGALFALPKLVVPSLSFRGSAFLAAGVAAVVLWTSLAILVARPAGARPGLVLVAIPLVFIATHAGYQSTAVGTEIMSLAFMAVLMALTLQPGAEATSPFSTLVLACAAGLIITVRANLTPYVVAAGVVWLSRLFREQPFHPVRVVSLAFLGAVPVAVGLGQILAVNHWMTGSWTESPYVFGDDSFRSVDFSHPHILSVLLHPWHGLLTYHPLYAVLVGTTASGLVTRTVEREWRAALWLFLTAAGATVVLQASWYAWWMGLNTFGGRQFGIWAVVFVAPWIHWHTTRQGASSTVRPLYGFIGLATLWSYLLLLGGATNFLSPSELLRGLWTILNGFVANHWHVVTLCVGALLPALLYRRKNRRYAGVVVLWSLVVLYLFEDNRLLPHRTAGAWIWLTPALETLTVALIAPAVGGWPQWQVWLSKLGLTFWRGTQVVTVLAFGLVATMFGRLSLQTPALPRAASEQCFSYRTTFDFPEVEATLLEYERVNGFDREKERLRAFVSQAESKYRTAGAMTDASQRECLSTHGVGGIAISP